MGILDLLSENKKEGLAAAGAAAGYSIAGTSTWLTIGSFALTVSNPIGWVIGATAACAAAGYGVAKLLENDGKIKKTEDFSKEEKERLDKERIAKSNSSNEAKYKQFESLLDEKVKKGRITLEKAENLRRFAKNGTYTIEVLRAQLEKV